MVGLGALVGAGGLLTVVLAVRVSRGGTGAAASVGDKLMREVIGMCLGESPALARSSSPVALEETEARGSAPGGPVFFRNSARSVVSVVSERGIGRGASGNVISLTLLGVNVK